jgi:hypothetical protein
MRLGALEGPIERVLGAAAARSDKTIRWVVGKERNPVLCAFSPAGTMVMADKAALTDQVRHTIYKAGLHAGLYKKVVPHDVRYGSTKDTAYLAPIQGNGWSHNCSCRSRLGSFKQRAAVWDHRTLC